MLWEIVTSDAMQLHADNLSVESIMYVRQYHFVDFSHTQGLK